MRPVSLIALTALTALPRRGRSGLGLSLSLILVGGCGPGGFAFDGGGFGEVGSDTAGTDDAASGSATASTGPGSTGTSETGTETETGTGTDDWFETETETETGEPEPIEPPTCARVWTHFDAGESHGHIGATPVGARPDGGFISVNPLLDPNNEPVNVDAWIRSWSPSGELEWEQVHSWADLRDDPRALIQDEQGTVFLGGRLNANNGLEDAMVAALDGATGEMLWLTLRGASGGYEAVTRVGAAVAVAGEIGGFDELEVLALDAEDGEILWSAMPELGPNVEVGGITATGANLDVLVAYGEPRRVEILRFAPPSIEAEVLVSLSDGQDPGQLPAVHELEPLSGGRLAALYSLDAASHLALVDRSTGEVLDDLALDSLGLAEFISATELVETPSGLALAGMASVDGLESTTFLLTLDPELEPLCLAFIGLDEIPGMYHVPHSNGLVRGPGSSLVTSSYVVSQRKSLFARWE